MPSDVDIWGYPDEAAAGRDLTGYSIEAIDGSIGKVDNANNDTGASWLIVDNRSRTPPSSTKPVTSSRPIATNSAATTDPVVAATKREPASLGVPASSTP